LTENCLSLIVNIIVKALPLSMSCTCIGKGCVFTYDAVGSYERTGYSAQGTGSSLIMPVLDNQLKSPSPLLLPARVSLERLYCFLVFLADVDWFYQHTEVNGD
jgi:20S proteasome alpha/beta subunit